MGPGGCLFTTVLEYPCYFCFVGLNSRRISGIIQGFLISRICSSKVPLCGPTADTAVMFGWFMLLVNSWANFVLLLLHFPAKSLDLSLFVVQVPLALRIWEIELQPRNTELGDPLNKGQSCGWGTGAM